ncbi:molybdopterin converting factor subunit 1 [Marinobacterium arenosum]|uniref:molybdopterin converting factor subunit 1 n=1 Tax=Marinobacterium arenosum TaxID=2862496 RepID=UPI001C98CAEE|nr:molybdopterin converting factor subunit 1 [Marinobacterium arenosum]MBY4676383.1 molybdopterin converting factor subunit 1 [Marinobacterium arenosum]
MVRIRFFASLREQLGQAELRLSVPDGIDVESLISQLGRQQPGWAGALASNELICAVNEEVVGRQHPLHSGDELAIFPPVTGG